MSWVRALDAVPAMRAYRAHAEIQAVAELEKARHQLANGVPRRRCWNP